MSDLPPSKVEERLPAHYVHWSPCVVVADDEVDILDVVRLKLRAAGMCVHPVTTGADVLETVRATPVDLVVLDIAMSGLSGLDVLAAMKSDVWLRNVPVVCLSARASDRDVAAGFLAGAADYLTKPFSPRELLHRIQAVLAGGRPGTAMP